MALGFGSKTANSPTNENITTTASQEKDPKNEKDGVFGRSDSDAERQSDDTSINVGRQIEMEAGNAIQYRTCSWQKLCYP
jgi:hypothetical protein